MPTQKPSEIFFTNTATRSKERFQSLEPGVVRLYTCGPTVYDYAHIGNFRTYVFEDVLRRSLEFFGYRVQHVMNLTDVDDKTIRGAIKKGVSLQQYTAPYIEAFFQDLDTLHIERAQHYPAATDYIAKMIDMIQALVQKGIAYQGSDQSVYYSIDRFPEYGALSHLPRENLRSGASGRVASDEYEKEHVGDFVLWKHYDSDRDGMIFWESPFGPGRPGWHLECSTMAIELLGTTLDIHCGGVDNIFPHHENEIAQSEAFSEKPFAKYWLHAEHLVVDNKKMSKSLGNFYRLRDLLGKGYTGSQVRYLLLQTHYKMPLNFTMQGLQAAKEAIHRLNACVHRLQTFISSGEGDVCALHCERAMEDFSLHLADDLNTSAALADVFGFVREVNTCMDQNRMDATEVEQALAFFQQVNRVLAVISFVQEREVPKELQEMLARRNQARKEKNWAEADALRDAISARGYAIEDSTTGSHLRRKE